MEISRTFAYILLASFWNREIEEMFTEWGVLDLIELTMEAEEQAESLDALWGVEEWKDVMLRIAPVQLTLGWDPRPVLLRAFGHGGVNPYYRSSDDSVIYFTSAPDEQTLSSTLPMVSSVSSDQERFCEVLVETAKLAHAQHRGVLFIGAWGWSYQKDEIPPEIKPILEKAGMQFLTRHS